MKWFKKWIFKMTQEGSMLMQESDQQAKYADQHVPMTSRESLNRFSNNGINFTLYKANGGFVLEYRTPPSYNNKSLRGGLVAVDEVTMTKLHIITNDQDLGQQISQIITFEALHQ